MQRIPGLRLLLARWQPSPSHLARTYLSAQQQQTEQVQQIQREEGEKDATRATSSRSVPQVKAKNSSYLRRLALWSPVGADVCRPGYHDDQDMITRRIHGSVSAATVRWTAPGALLARFCRDLTAEARSNLLDPVVGRDDIIQRTLRVGCTVRA